MNSEGYRDETAEMAMRSVELEDRLEKEAKISVLVTAFKDLAKLAGFQIEGRIVFRDIKTKKVYR